ncbi:unnamed protein product, partial [Amoebophrya sp. A25]|eukprot:GSA25T00022556001.1
MAESDASEADDPSLGVLGGLLSSSTTHDLFRAFNSVTEHFTLGRCPSPPIVGRSLSGVKDGAQDIGDGAIEGHGKQYLLQWELMWLAMESAVIRYLDLWIAWACAFYFSPKVYFRHAHGRNTALSKSAHATTSTSESRSARLASRGVCNTRKLAAAGVVSFKCWDSLPESGSASTSHDVDSCISGTTDTSALSRVFIDDSASLLSTASGAIGHRKRDWVLGNVAPDFERRSLYMIALLNSVLPTLQEVRAEWAFDGKAALRADMLAAWANVEEQSSPEADNFTAHAFKSVNQSALANYLKPDQHNQTQRLCVP